MIKVSTLTITRGDRPEMLSNMKRLMERQVLQPHGMVIVDDEPKSKKKKDITWRYRVGLQRVFEQHPDTDLVAFIEDDDYYGENYLLTMAGSFNLQHIKPALIGFEKTYYYHLEAGVQVLDHPDRSSMFTTCVTREVYDDMVWPKDDYSFVDIEMWKQFRGLLIREPRHNYLAELAMGIKGYGEGDLFGGSGHSQLKRYSKDNNMEFLKHVVDDESFEFYTNLKIKTN